MVNSMSIRNDQSFQQNSMHPMDGKSDKKLDMSRKSDIDHIVKKILNDYQEKQKAFQLTYQKIQKQCQMLPREPSEADIMSLIKNLTQLQQNTMKVKYQIQQSLENYPVPQFNSIYNSVTDLEKESTILKALCYLDQGQNFESIKEFNKICAEYTQLSNQNKNSDSLTSDQLLKMNL